MTCRRCGRQFSAAEGPACPNCGEVNRAGSPQVLKSSTILISTGDTEAVYRSVKEVPPPLRRKLLKSTNGLNSATILIADRKGRDEIARAIQTLPSSLQRRFLKPYREEPGGATAWLARPAVKAIVAWMLGAASVVMLWLMFGHKWY